MKHPFVLIILDGFGYSPNTKYNAIAQAKTPHITAWQKTYPHTLLDASGPAVGLPGGYVGNSHVGHLTIGAGTIIPQPLTIINQAIDNGSFFTNKTLIDNLQTLHKTGGNLHILSLLSDAGIHGHQNHLYAFLQAAKNAGIKQTYIHAILDGRDVPPHSAHHYLQQLEQYIQELHYGTIGSVHGRFYAMDRDANWQRTEKSYNVLTQPQTTQKSWQAILSQAYQEGISDEFIEPQQVDKKAVVANHDGVIFCNIRSERALQLTNALTDQHFKHFPTKHLLLTFFITPVLYHSAHTTELFATPQPVNTLKEVLLKQNKTVISIAESEKAAQITYFFNGEKEIAQEHVIIVPSHKHATFAQDPEMSAAEITKAALNSLKTEAADFYLINYANADMVGHSGNLQATVKAIECLDTQLSLIFDQVITKMNGTMVITADHGNAEQMFDETTQQPNTAHTANKVPFIYINNDRKHVSLSLTQLADIAPFIVQNI